jgi:hypothetical protein
MSSLQKSVLDWKCGSRGQVPALQVCNPEFKPKKERERGEERRGEKGGKERKIKKVSILGLGAWLE